MWSGGPAGICTRVSVSHVAFVTDEAAGPSRASFSESFLLHGGLEMKQIDGGDDGKRRAAAADGYKHTMRVTRLPPEL